MTYSKYFIVFLFFFSCEEAILFQEATGFHTIVIVSNERMKIITQPFVAHESSGYTTKHFEVGDFRIYLNEKKLRANIDYFIKKRNERLSISLFEIKKDLYISLDKIHIKITYEETAFEAWIKPLKEIDKATIEYYRDHCKWIPPEGDVASKIYVSTYIKRKGQIVSKLSGSVSPSSFIFKKFGKWKIFKSGQSMIPIGKWVKENGYPKYIPLGFVKDTSDYFYENTRVSIYSYDKHAVRHMFDSELKGENVIGNGVAFSYSITEDTVRFLR